jgi:hypothetical protein
MAYPSILHGQDSSHSQEFQRLEEHLSNRVQHNSHRQSNPDATAEEHLVEYLGWYVMHCSGRPVCSTHISYSVQVETGFVDGKIEIRGYDTTNSVMDSLLKKRLFEFLDRRVLRKINVQEQPCH